MFSSAQLHQGGPYVLHMFNPFFHKLPCTYIPSVVKFAMNMPCRLLTEAPPAGYMSSQMATSASALEGGGVYPAVLTQFNSCIVSYDTHISIITSSTLIAHRQHLHQGNPQDQIAADRRRGSSSLLISELQINYPLTYLNHP